MRFFIISALLIASAAADGIEQFKSEALKGISQQDEIYSHGITLQCDFGMIRHYWGEMYTCIARNLVTRHHYDYIMNATGDHMTGKTDKDVEAVYILGQRTRFLPYNISTPFNGVKAIRVEGSGLLFLNRTLKYEGPLEYLHLENNLLRTVPSWAFRGLTNLKWLSLRNNHIKYLESTMFRDMKSLRRFSASSNLIEVVPTGLFFYTPELEEVYFYNNKIRMIGGRLVASLGKLKVAVFMGNPCTQISVYDGVNVISRLSTEFTTKCGVNCVKAEEAAQDHIKDLREELQKKQECSSAMNEVQKQREYQNRMPAQPQLSAESQEH
ncbi:unnamed protein product [Chironomus riparius]|uniref:Uncharacterized protein n=1 Tax=Chironomus riparius TaxID=315576 RepID=A0A9N9WZ85_9DIPT|nr:unnamed protein product [Chironomus riparius]